MTALDAAREAVATAAAMPNDYRRALALIDAASALVEHAEEQQDRITLLEGVVTGQDARMRTLEAQVAKVTGYLYAHGT